MVSVPNKVCVKSKKSEKTCTVCVFMTESNTEAAHFDYFEKSTQCVHIYIYTVYIYIFIYMYKHKRAATGLIQINSS